MAQPAERMRRPRCRAECQDGARPCPWVDCRYHLGDAVGESCALDVAGWGGASFAEIAELLGVSRQRVQQIVEKAVVKVTVRVHRQLARQAAERRAP